MPEVVASTPAEARGEPVPGADVPLAALTTLHLGGPARRLVVAASPEELVEVVSACDRDGEPVLVLGGGSNVVVADEGFEGTVVRVASRGVVVDDLSDCAGATVTVAAGEPWDALVATAVEREWVGLEALSGIPGLTGASPIQNVGAYGADVSQTIASVRTWDRRDGAYRTLPAASCAFGYRSSRFKAEPGRHLVLSVTFQLELGTLAAPVRYAELARALGVELGGRAPARQVRQAVLALRAGKGMVLDEDDHDTWSAGSFFTNPVLEPEQAAALPEDAPRFAQPDGRVKTSAAWLIERSGFPRGYGEPPATVSTKHTLALTNRGGASTAQLLSLASTIRDGVHRRYGVVLEPEPQLVGCTLAPLAG